MARRRPRQVPLVEWVAGLVSAVILLGTIGYLVYATLQPGSDEPILTVTVVQTRESDGSFVVDVEVRNRSRGAAADVHIAGRVRSVDSFEAHGEARVDYVPGFSTRRASLVFGVDPGGHGAVVRIVGYSRP
jgi:uncharacterized protein (TIGR02588 family)